MDHPGGRNPQVTSIGYFYAGTAWTGTLDCLGSVGLGEVDPELPGTVDCFGNKQRIGDFGFAIAD